MRPARLARAPRARRPGPVRARRLLRVRTLLAMAAEREAAGDVAGCGAALERAVRIAPRHPRALHALARHRHLQGADAEAAALMARLVALRPHHASLHNDLGNLRLSLGDLAGALAAYGRALELAPDAPDTLFNASVALVRAARPGEALAMLDRARAVAGDDPGIWVELGKVRLQLHDAGAAERAFRRALELDQRSADACSGLAAAAITSGAPEEARRWLHAALSREPGHPGAWLQLARSRLDAAQARQAIGHLEGALASESDPELISTVHFTLGQLHDELAEHDRAFEHLRAGNRMVRERAGFDRAAYVERVARVVDAFPAGLAGECRGLGDGSAAPVLIAGAPRSGTTLVEQIIASHPRSAGLGEAAHLDGLVARTGLELHELARETDRWRWAGLAREYLALARSRHPRAERLTDKTPSLVFQLGLLGVLFPRATLIHCVRDPLDTGVSIYSQRFAHGAMPWAYRLEDIGTALRGVRRLMDHWHRVFPGRIHVVSYESLVSDQEAESRRLIARCGLDWDERCIDFHATRRDVHTASMWQVRRPLYRTSVGRAAAYRPHLDALVRALEAS